MIYFDTETCGFHGPTVLIQYAQDQGDIHLHEVWCEPISETLELIRWFCEDGVIGFNLAFDWFHIAQTYTVLEALGGEIGYNKEPRDYIDEYAQVEPIGRDGPCVKPETALDLLLYARKGPYQETMERKEIRIRKVPRVLAPSLVHELDRRLKFEDYLFSRRKTSDRWKIFATDSPAFVDVVLRFAPSAALKVLAHQELKISKEEILLMKDVEPESGLKLTEVGWAPFALALSNKEKDWKTKNGYAWPAVIQDHISHWRFHPSARKYATDDVVYTRGIHESWGSPEPGDDDSVLACLVGASRWRGFKIDTEKLEQLLVTEIKNTEAAPRYSVHVKKFLMEVMSETEAAVFKEEGSTKKVVLERISEQTDDQGNPTPAAERAKLVLSSRKGYNKVTLFRKLLQAGRLHASATVIGSLSGRNSGRTEVGDGRRSANLNALGIQNDKTIRGCFPLAFGGLKLHGGDFAGFEVSIAEARYNDPELRKQLLTCSVCKNQVTPDEYRHAKECPHCGSTDKGEVPTKKLHLLFACALFPDKTEEEILATKGSGEKDLYDKGKKGVFGGLIYGGDENTLYKRLGIPLEIGTVARANFLSQYKGMLEAQKEIFNKFCSMRQPGGLGKAVEWHQPAEFIESLNGFRRWFTLENRICEALFKLANKPPKQWDELSNQVYRRDRWQKVGGAIRSALYACAFQIQAHSMRAATNHEIQSTGAILCKQLQVLIWNLQPAGVNPWRVQPFNIHDELMCPAVDELVPEIEKIVADFVEETKKLIPLIKIDWSSFIETWADK